MSRLIHGAAPAVFDPPGDAVQISPRRPGSTAIEALEAGSADSAFLMAPPGTVERRWLTAQAIRVVRPGGTLTVLAPKTRGGSRLADELKAFGLDPVSSAKAHHRRCDAVRPQTVQGVDEAIRAGEPRRVQTIDAWSQPGVFAWDRIDPGSALLLKHMPPMKGEGADLGCGWGALGRVVLTSDAVTGLRLVDLDRRAVEAARRNLDQDARASFEWADVLTLPEGVDLDFVVVNPPFHDGGTEDRRLGQAFIRKAAGMLRTGGVLWLTANRHLPYEAELGAALKRVRPVADAGGYKLFEATK